LDNYILKTREDKLQSELAMELKAQMKLALKQKGAAKPSASGMWQRWFGNGLVFGSCCSRSGWLATSRLIPALVFHWILKSRD
jgi:hypothetical protein